MKKYFILGIAVLAVAVILVSFPWNQTSQADVTGHAFSGVFQSGRSILAQHDIFQVNGVDEGDDWYHIDIPAWMTGWWTLTDGCQHFTRYWDGETFTRVDFCNPQNCDCN
jgi:hypothetical protein